jgi:uncharacterized protein with beta-barrel porin domain
MHTRSDKIAIAAIVLFASVFATPASVRAQNLASFGILGGSTVTNTGPSVINGNVGLSPGSSITGFPPGIVVAPGAIFNSDATAIQAQVQLITLFNTLSALPVTHNLSGQNLGGLTLTPGVYGFNSSAQLTGGLTLNALGNPNAIFVINIGSTLTTASGASISLINGAQASNVFFKVGSSATLGSTTAFQGDIVALSSISLDAGASINCGAALAHNGAVTLINNAISICRTTSALVSSITGVPEGATVFTIADSLPASASGNQFAVANGLDAFIASGGVLTPAFLNLIGTLSPSQLAAAFTELSGEVGTGAAPAGVQAMNSFLSLLTNPFANHGFTPENQPRPLIYKDSLHNTLAAEAGSDQQRWSIWAAGYGSQYDIAGNAAVGSHDSSGRTGGGVMGIDYRLTPYTTVGVAIADGSTNYGLSDGLGGGRGDMFQSAAYSMTRLNAAYVAAVLAFGWDRVSTSRSLTLEGIDTLTADFSAYDFSGRIEGGYRFAIPGMYALPGFGITPYGAFQLQAFRTPSYNESAALGSTAFALTYNAQTTNTYRTEVGAWFDETIQISHDASLSVWNRAAWAQDHWSNDSITASFQALSGSRFTVVGAAPTGDSLLASAGAGIFFRNGISLAANFDTELTQRWQTYSGTAWLRYAF